MWIFLKVWFPFDGFKGLKVVYYDLTKLTPWVWWPPFIGTQCYL